MEIATRRREQEVWQACDDLWALHGDTKFLTGDAIRERLLSLGKSRGSPNEIYRYRKSWSESRAIEKNSNIQNPQEQDPISRAVRIVHEKLLSEADEKIEHIKSDYESQLSTCQQELEKKQTDLAQVINELGHTQIELAKNQKELAEIQKILNAEIEVRKAQDRELVHVKNSHERILVELKAAYQEAHEKLINIFKTQEQEFKTRIDNLESEKKILGIEFSEKLTEIKTSNYNQALLVKNLQQELDKNYQDLEEKNQVLQQQATKIKAILEEYNNLTKQFDILEISHARVQKEHLQALRKITQSEVTIARLRATQAAVLGGLNERRPRAQKGAAQAINT